MSKVVSCAFRVEVVSGDGTGAIAEGNETKPVTIGRSRESVLCVANPTVSRRHAVVEVTPTGVLIRDAGSLAGVIRSGEAIPPAGYPVGASEDFRLGTATIRVTVSSPHAQPSRDPGARSTLAASAPMPKSGAAGNRAGATGAESRGGSLRDPPASTKPAPIKAAPPKPSRDEDRRGGPSPLTAALGARDSESSGPPEAASDRDAPGNWSGRAGKTPAVKERFADYGILAIEDHAESGDETALAIDMKRGDRVALRRIPAGLLGWLGRRRFLRECESRFDLSHPNLAAPRAAGKEGDRIFVATPQRSGFDVEHIVRDRRGKPDLPLTLVAYCGREVALALTYLEKARGASFQADVRARNVRIGSDGAIQLRDLGPRVARGKDPDRYAAPEAEGEESGDTRSAIFSLGVVLYEMFTGERVDAERKTTLRSVDTVRIDIAPALAEATMRALEVRPEDRFRSATEMAGELGRALAALEPRADRDLAKAWLMEHYREEMD